MRKTILALSVAAFAVTATPALADPPPWAPAHGKRAKHYQHSRVYDNYGRYSEPRRLSYNDRIWRGGDGRYYCRRDNGTTGLIIGFDERSMLLMPYGPPYAPARIEQAGYAKLIDLYSYEYDVRKAPVTIGHRLIERYAKGRVKVRSVDMSRFADELLVAIDIFNDAWSDNWGFVPITKEEMQAAAKTMKPLVEPRLIWLAELDDKPVAMILTLPNLNEAVADMGGKLFPFNWAKLLWRLKVKRVKSGRCALMGVRMSLRNTPLGAALAMMVIDKLRENGTALGYEFAELGWILETNAVTRRIIEQAGGREYKSFRLYSKALA